MVKSALGLGMTRWERVSRVAAAVVVGLLIWGAQATAQSPGYAAVAVDGHGAWGASLGLSTPDAAGADAVKRCGGNCRVVMTGRPMCRVRRQLARRLLVWTRLWQQCGGRSEYCYGGLLGRCAGRHVSHQAC